MLYDVVVFFFTFIGAVLSGYAAYIAVVETIPLCERANG